MALIPQVAGRLVRVTGVMIVSTPTDSSFVIASWCQLNVAEIARKLALPSDWNYAFHSVEVLNTHVTGGITTYEVRVHLSLT